jgi:hypothetical protein
MAQLHAQLHFEHVSLAGGANEEVFQEEVRNARSRYSSYGRLTLPWLKWGPDKTTAQLYQESQARRQDPAFMELLESAQAELEERANKFKGMVAQEAEVIKEATERRKLRAQTYRKSRRGRLLRTTR